MTEPAASHGIDNPDVALPRLVDSLVQRFPDVDRGEIEAQVHATYARLEQEATVDAHLVAMTEGQVTDELRRRGETVHVRGQDV